jgi:hypothetical protein
MPERVVINIEVNSDVATIEATREALRRLRDEEENYNRERDRGRRTTQQTNRENQRTRRDHDLLGNTLRRQARNTAALTGRYAGLLKQTFALRKDIGTLIGAFGGMIKFINKLSLIEIPLLAAGLSTITMLFKMGPGFIKLYKAAMSGLAYSAAAVGVAIATVVAAQREFQSVQFAPMYVDGANNTADRFVAASQAMQMFTGSTRLAVVGAESLQKAFGTLSKQKAVTGNTVAAFEGLMNIVAGSGGDIGKGSEKLAEFLAMVQKKGLGGASDIAKELGPDFETIIKEAKALGVKTSDEFFKAAAEGTLGATFQKKYAGQLDALNNTLFGRFKIAMTELKNSLAGLGDEFLGPAGDALDNMVTQLKITIARLSPMLSSFGPGFLKDIEEGFEKMTNKFVEMMNKYLNTTPTFIEQSKKIFDSIGSWFDGIQDWARQFVPAGRALIDNFFRPVWDGLVEKFSGGINTLSDLVLTNTDKLKVFANDVVQFIAAIGDYGNMLKEAFIAALPMLSIFIRGMTKILNLFTSLMKGIMRVFGSMGDMSKAVGAIIAIYASLTIFSRFFKTLGGMFGKDMSIRANNVFVNGQPVGSPIGGGPVGSPTGPMYGPRAPLSLGRAQGRLRGLGVSAMSAGRNFVASPMSSMAIMAGGQMLNMAGNSIGGQRGTALSTAGNVATVAGMGRMMGLSGRATGALAVIPAAYGTSKMATNFIQDMPGFKKGTLGKDDAIGKIGMTAAGAGAGAATGAAIGAALAPFTAGISVAAFASIGAVVGGITGYINSGKYQKEARNAAKSMVDTFTQATEKAFAAGNIEDLKTARKELIATHEANLKNLADTAEYNKKLGNFANTLAKFDKELVNYTHNAALAERAFGIGTDELNRLANEAGVNLRGRMLNLVDVIKLAGQTVTQQVALMKQEWSKLSGLAVTGVFKKFQDERERRETGRAVDAAESAIASGKFTPESIDTLLESAAKYGIAQYGEFGGLGSVIPTLLDSMATGTLQNLSQEQKDALLKRATDVFSNQEIMKSIVDSEKGAQLLKDVAGSTGALGGKSSQELQAMIMARMNEQGPGMGGFFLQNLQDAYQNALITGNMSNVNRLIMGNQGYSAYMSDTQDAATRGLRGRSGTLSSVPPPAVTTNNTTVNVSGILDKTIVDKIIVEIERNMRTNWERGGPIPSSLGPR